VDACPSHAISLSPASYPPPQSKADAVCEALLKLAQSKLTQARIAEGVVQSAIDADTRQIADAVTMSNRLMAEDLLRESGYLLPQSESVCTLLKALLKEPPDEAFPADAARRLLELL
jgi:hypothetical protein